MCVGQGSAKQGLYSPIFPVRRQPRVQWAVRALDLLKAESVEASSGTGEKPVLPAGVYAVGIVNFCPFTCVSRSVGFRRCHLSAATAHPFTERT